jgi:hypothetical protein
MGWWWADARGHGRLDVYVNFGTQNVNRHTGVLANICELKQPQGEALDFPHLGAADMTIRNIVPRDDGVVAIRCDINWSYDLPIRLNFLLE